MWDIVAQRRPLSVRKSGLSIHRGHPSYNGKSPFVTAPHPILDVKAQTATSHWKAASACLLPALMLLAGCPSQPRRAVTPPQAQAPGISTPSKPAAPTQSPQQAAIDFNAQAVIAQRNQRLIDQVERSYQSGATNYRAGHLDAARQDFDFAVDLMLTSGYDLQSDPQLSDEFNHIVDAVNSLEMDALREGNGFSPKVEAAPVDSANDITFSPNPELVAKLKTELNTTSDLPLIINDQVAGYIGVFSNSTSFRAHMAASLKRAGKYKAMIQKILAEQGVPQDLIYLSVAESGFQPQALNARSGAGGMWQFMPFAGAYGLERNGWFDERFDPEKSTIAYAKYMKTLYDSSATGIWPWRRMTGARAMCSALSAALATPTTGRSIAAAVCPGRRAPTYPRSLPPFLWPRIRSSMGWIRWSRIPR